MATTLQKDYPWTSQPLVISAPMRLIALSKLASAVSSARGLGFMAIGSETSTLSSELEQLTSTLIPQSTHLQSHVQTTGTLPIGIGVFVWAGETFLSEFVSILSSTPAPPVAVWLFAPSGGAAQLAEWSKAIRNATGGRSKIWIQIGTVAEAVQTVRQCGPDVLVVQGGDAGGHGLMASAGVMTLFPEVQDRVAEMCKGSSGLREPVLVAAGGIADGRTAAAALTLGAAGVVMGTRFLASPEAVLAVGYREAVVAAGDGGVSTARGKLYDRLRGTTDWPEQYGGRAVLNRSWWDAQKGMGFEENKRLYDSAVEQGDAAIWGDDGRLTTYAGAVVGLVKEVKAAGEIVQEVRDGAVSVLKAAASKV